MPPHSDGPCCKESKFFGHKRFNSATCPTSLTAFHQSRWSSDLEAKGRKLWSSGRYTPDADLAGPKDVRKMAVYGMRGLVGYQSRLHARPIFLPLFDVEMRPQVQLRRARPPAGSRRRCLYLG